MIGNPVSFMQPELGEAIAMMDENLQAALRRSLSGETQPFTITAKITFTPVSGAFYPQYEVGHQFDPIKVKSKASARDYLHIAQDKFGVPVFFEDGESQMSFDEIDAGATVTADASGVVQSIELDDADFERVFPCDCSDCPLHTVYTGGEEGCSFCGDTDAPLDSDLKGYIYDAVTVHRCTRDCVNEICEREFPTDQPEPEPYPCEEADCHLCDFGAECDLHEDGTSLLPYEDKHIISAVEEFRCTRKFVRRRYGEIVKEGRNDD